jgi:hypothetical protein
MHEIRTLLTIAACAAGLAGTAPALASAPESWSSHKAEVIAKCAKASGLKDAKLVGEIVEYDDAVGYTAALFTGTYPQPHMKNQPGRSLCLFDKRSRAVHAAPADALK